VGVSPSRRGTCPKCGSGEVLHLVFGLPGNPEAEPDWVRFEGCVIDGVPDDRECESCGHRWVAGRAAERMRRDLR